MATQDSKLQESKIEYDPDDRAGERNVPGWEEESYLEVRTTMNCLLELDRFLLDQPSLSPFYDDFLDKCSAADLNRYPADKKTSNFFGSYLTCFLNNYAHLSAAAKGIHLKNIEKMLKNGADPCLPMTSPDNAAQQSIIETLVDVYQVAKLCNPDFMDPEEQGLITERCNAADEILKVLVKYVNSQRLLDSIKAGSEKKVLANRIKALGLNSEPKREGKEHKNKEREDKERKGKEREVKKGFNLPTPEDKFKPTLEKALGYLSQFEHVTGVSEIIKLIAQVEQVKKYPLALMPERSTDKKLGLIYIRYDANYEKHHTAKERIQYMVIAPDGKEKSGYISLAELGMTRGDIEPFELKKLESVSDYLKNKISVTTSDLRKKVEALDQVATNHPDLFAVTHYTLLALTANDPVNFYDIFSTDSIKPSDLIYASGYQYDINSLIGNHNNRNYLGSQGEQHGSKFLRDACNKKFDSRDVAHIEAFVAHVNTQRSAHEKLTIQGLRTEKADTKKIEPKKQSPGRDRKHEGNSHQYDGLPVDGLHPEVSLAIAVLTSETERLETEQLELAKAISLQEELQKGSDSKSASRGASHSSTGPRLGGSPEIKGSKGKDTSQDDELEAALAISKFEQEEREKTEPKRNEGKVSPQGVVNSKTDSRLKGNAEIAEIKNSKKEKTLSKDISADEEDISEDKQLQLAITLSLRQEGDEIHSLNGASGNEALINPNGRPEDRKVEPQPGGSPRQSSSTFFSRSRSASRDLSPLDGKPPERQGTGDGSSEDEASASENKKAKPEEKNDDLRERKESNEPLERKESRLSLEPSAVIVQQRPLRFATSAMVAMVAGSGILMEAVLYGATYGFAQEAMKEPLGFLTAGQVATMGFAVLVVCSTLLVATVQHCREREQVANDRLRYNISTS